MTLQPSLEGMSDLRISERMRMVLALAEFREEWQELSDGRSLLGIESPVGLLLSDIAEKLELTPQERHVFLGGKLIKEITGFLETPVRLKLPL